MLVRSEKRCPKCNTVKPITEFYKHKGKRPDGHKAICKSCEKIYIQSNPEMKRRIQAKYREAHRDDLREQDRIYRASHREKKRAKLQEWRLRNPEKQILYTETRRARILGSGGVITAKQWVRALEFYGNKCLCCGATDDITLDHVVPVSVGGANVIENIQPLCQICNSRKCQKTIDYRNGRIYTGEQNDRCNPVFRNESGSPSATGKGTEGARTQV